MEIQLVGYDTLFSVLTLTFLEIILGIDNLIFIALVVAKLPRKNKKTARIFGVTLAIVIRILMLMTLSAVMTMTKPVFHAIGVDFSYKDFLLIFGGLFLVIKSGAEIFSDIFHASSHETKKIIKVYSGLIGASLQIALIDFIFSFDSLMTAVGMTNNVPVIVTAIVISMLMMLVASGYITEFLNTYPSLKIVALSFIFMVGVILLADGFHIHISKGYLYFALFFTIAVESLNIAARQRH